MLRGTIPKEGHTMSCNIRTTLAYSASQNRHGRLAQLARAPRLHRGSRGFESLIAHFYNPLPLLTLEQTCRRQ